MVLFPAPCFPEKHYNKIMKWNDWHGLWAIGRQLYGKSIELKTAVWMIDWKY